MKARSRHLASASPRALLLYPLMAAAFVSVTPQAAVAQTTSQPAAQAPAAAGALRGRVLDTVSGEYLRNAEVRVEGTGIVAYSEDGGAFRLSGVPTGEVTLVVRYAGLQDARATASVVAGQITVVDIALKAPLYAGSDEASAVEDIVVTAARGGQAKALMERRVAMNAKNVVPADNSAP
ncbi:carboxypeptidase regulatory-like domain-containing protein [Brevundimonas sp. LF-1]|uniref:carboxypeptidase regulatory-like domain-containing protein n=1 Tax=Brevundimonas sp. LF-1 TaxID=3126100 RepID=UPI0030E3CF59